MAISTDVKMIGSIKVKKGIEYPSLPSSATAIMLTDNTKVSIGRTPFIELGKNTIYYIDSTKTISFDKDTVVGAFIDKT